MITAIGGDDPLKRFRSHGTFVGVVFLRNLGRPLSIYGIFIQERPKEKNCFFLFFFFYLCK